MHHFPLGLLIDPRMLLLLGVLFFGGIVLFSESSGRRKDDTDGLDRGGAEE
jgi:hypothetical protein